MCDVGGVEDHTHRNVINVPKDQFNAFVKDWRDIAKDSDWFTESQMENLLDDLERLADTGVNGSS